METMSNKSLRIAFVVVSLAFLWTLLRNEQFRGRNKDLTSEVTVLENKVDSLKLVADSLYDENFPCQIEVGRYQVAYEIFMERNPKAAKEYGTIISEETE